MLEKSHGESNIIPDDLKVKNLGGSLFEIEFNENVSSFQKESEMGFEIFYECDKTLLRERILNRGEAIVAFIRMKYSANDELALTNKGIANNQNAEYLAYRDYVSWCKEQASVYFSEVQ